MSESYFMKYMRLKIYLHAILYHCNSAVFVNLVRAWKNLTSTKGVLKPRKEKVKVSLTNVFLRKKKKKKIENGWR